MEKGSYKKKKKWKKGMKLDFFYCNSKTKIIKFTRFEFSAKDDCREREKGWVGATWEQCKCGSLLCSGKLTFTTFIDIKNNISPFQVLSPLFSSEIIIGGVWIDRDITVIYLLHWLLPSFFSLRFSAFFLLYCFVSLNYILNCFPKNLNLHN